MIIKILIALIIQFKRSLDRSSPTDFIKTENGKEVTIEVRCANGRSGESLFTASMGDSLSGSNNWQKYWGDIPIDEGANYFDIRLNSGVPDSGFAFSWFVM